VVLVVIDTLRADAVAAAATPNIDRIAAQGDAVPRAWAAGTWTVPSTISLFSGMPVRTHGWNEPFFAKSEGASSLPPAPDVPLLAEVLRDGGVATHGLYANPLLGQLGLDRGFDDLRRVPERKLARRLSRLVEGWDPATDHFVYLHYLGPHQPLKPSDAAAARWEVPPAGARPTTLKAARGAAPAVVEAYRRAYHAVVEDSDRRLGKALDALGPWADEAVIIVTSDHGELLGEHGIHGHSRYVWEPLTHVPLVARGLGDLPDAMVTTGLAARVTDAFGVAHAWPEAGTRPLPLVSQREDKLALSPDGHTKAIWDPRDLPHDDGFATFDLTADPGEERPSADRRAAFDAARTAWEAQTPAGAAASTDASMTD
jgi:arylsulfatase A-like enzyme